MKKTLLLIFALVTSIGMAWGQNLSQGKYVHLLPNGTSNVTESNLQGLTNGNTDDDVQLATFANETLSPIQAFYIDLGEVKDLSRVVIYWEGALCTNYSIKGSTTTGESNSPEWDKDFGTYSVARGSTHSETHEAPENFSTRYIKFEPANNGSTEGYSNPNWTVKMREFQVFGTEIQILSGLEFDQNIKKAGTSQSFIAKPLDQNGNEITTGSFTFSISPSAGVTFSQNGNTLTITASQGVYTITATDGENNITVPIGLASAPDDPSIDSDKAFVIYSEALGYGQAGSDASVGYRDPHSSSWSMYNWGENRNSIVFRQVGAFGISRPGLSATNMADIVSLEFDMFSTKAVNDAQLEIEDCYNSGHVPGLTFDVVAGWHHYSIPIDPTRTNFSPAKWMFFYLANPKDENIDILIDNVYYSTVPPAPAGKSVTFIKPDGWSSVYVWAWKGTPNEEGYENFTGGTWPGEAATDNQDGTFTWTTTGDPEKIIFSDNGNLQTSTFTFIDGATYDSGGNVKRGYYIVGTMNSWTLSDEFKMTKNDAQTSYNEYMFEKLSLESSDEFKINYSADGVTKSSSYYPTNNITGYKGPYNVYFCPEGGRDGWLNGYVYMQQTYNVVVDGNKATVTGDINAGNLDAVKAAVGMSTYVDVSGATIETDFSTDNPNALYLYATAEAAAAATHTPNPVRYDGSRFYVAPQGLTFTDAPATSLIPENAFSSLSSDHMVTINRSIAGNKYVTSFMSRAASPGYPMVATLAEGLEAYELKAAEAGLLTFSKVTGALETNKGYVIHNTTSDPLTLTWDSHQNDQIYLDNAGNQDPASVDPVNGVKIVGTMHTITTESELDQWILSGNEIKKGTGAKISPYRAYFTGVTLPALGKASAVFVDGETTKIGSINANGEISVEDGIIYNLAGQRVQNPTKGIYIINGKKVVIK